MLKKSLKEATKLEARATKASKTPLLEKSKLVEKIRALRKDLEFRAKEHDAAASQARTAAQRLSKLLDAKVTKAAKKKAAPPAQTSKKPAVKSKSKATTSTDKTAPESSRVVKDGPSLAQAIERVLGSNQGKKNAGLTARQLHAAVSKVGYKFTGDKLENQMNYLHKVLRKFGTRIKRAANGSISITRV